MLVQPRVGAGRGVGIGAGTLGGPADARLVDHNRDRNPVHNT